MTSDLLEILQADVTALLKAVPALSDAVILADNEGDIEAKVVRALGTLTGAKNGLAAVVLLPEITESDANLPGPPLTVEIEIQTIEAVTINRQAGKGTELRSSQAALITLNALHLQSLGGCSLYSERDPITPVKVKPGYVSHAVKLKLRANGLQGPGKAAGITPELVAAGEAGIIITGELTGDGITALVFPPLLPPAGVINGKLNYFLATDAGDFGAVWQTTSNPYTGAGDFTGWFLQEEIDGIQWASTADVSHPRLVPSGAWHETSNPHAWRPISPATGTPVVQASDSILTLTTATTGAAIYYTLDGSYPTPATGTLYTAPFAAPETGTTVRAAAYKEGLNPGDCLEFDITE
jgi:hypothetical protein